MQKHFLSILLMPFLISACTSIAKDSGVGTGSNSEGTLTEHRTLVKKLSLQQSVSGGYTLCSEVGVWKCQPLTQKTKVNPFVEVSAAQSSSVNLFNGGTEEENITSSSRWVIQVGAYHTDAAIKDGVSILSAKNINFIQQKSERLTVLSVIGFSTKEDALRELNNFVKDFKDPFVKKMTQ